MEVRFTLNAEQESVIRHAIESGRLLGAEDAMKEAMTLWGERERRRDEILAVVDDAEASLARREGRVVTSREGARALAEDIKSRSLSRFTAEQSSR